MNPTIYSREDVTAIVEAKNELVRENQALSAENDDLKTQVAILRDLIEERELRLADEANERSKAQDRWHSFAEATEPCDGSGLDR